MKEHMHLFPFLRGSTVENMAQLKSTFKSIVLADDHSVIKKTRRSLPVQETYQKLDVLQAEWQIFCAYLTPYLVPTDMIVGQQKSRKASLYTFQPKVTGMKFSDAAEEIRHRHANPILITDFLERAIQMFRETGLLPDIYTDIFRTKPAVRWFTETLYPFATDNIIVVTENDLLKPLLIDTMVSQKGKMPILGGIQNIPTVDAMQRLKIELEQYRK